MTEHLFILILFLENVELFFKFFDFGDRGGRLSFFEEKAEKNQDKEDGKDDEEETPGNNPEVNSGGKKAALGAVTSQEAGLVAAKEPFFSQSVGKVSIGVGEDVEFFEFEFGGPKAKPVFDSDGAGGGDVDIRKVGESGMKVNWTVFGKFGSGETLNFGILFDGAGDGDVD